MIGLLRWKTGLKDEPNKKKKKRLRACTKFGQRESLYWCPYSFWGPQVAHW